MENIISPSLCRIEEKTNQIIPKLRSSVADPDPNPDPPDPLVFGPPGSGSGSISQGYGSASGSGSESGSGYISKRHGSAFPDRDPHQNVMDPQGP